MISKEEVKHIAKLARISLSENEVGKFVGELSSILDYVAMMNEVDTTGVLPAGFYLKEVLAKKGEISQIRKDQAVSQSEEVVEEMLAQAPAEKDRFLKVKRVFKNR